MKVFLVVLIAILVLLFGIKINIYFDFIYSKDRVNFTVKIFNFDLSKFIVNSKKKNNKDEAVKNQRQRKKIDFQISISLFIELLNKIRYLKNKPILDLYNYLEFGFGEADKTALIYGYINIIFSFVEKLISNYINFNEKSRDIVPRYNSNILKLHFKGILKIKVAQIIHISILFITLGRKLSNESTSNRKFNEECT